MNAQLLSIVEQKLAELEALVREELQRLSDEQLDELVDAHLRHPVTIVTASLVRNPGKFAAMAAIPIQRERLRRAEIAAMEGAV